MMEIVPFERRNRMKRNVFAAVLALALVVPGVSFAVDAYQVTGKVVEFEKDKSVTVLKGKENFQITLDKDTKITGELKKDAKVTVHYKMTATSVEAKSEGKEKKEAKKK
jgi:hypothetical protein